jgi:hypothetical protein
MLSSANRPKRYIMFAAEMTPMDTRSIPIPTQQYANARRLAPFHSPETAPQNRATMTSRVMKIDHPTMPPIVPSEAAPTP